MADHINWMATNFISIQEKAVMIQYLEELILLNRVRALFLWVKVQTQADFWQNFHFGGRDAAN